MCSSDIFLTLLAILFPPIAVWIKVGICTADSLINIALCTLGFIPGLLHAWYIIAKHPEPEYEYEYRTVSGGDDTERQGRGGAGVTYYYVNQDSASGYGNGQQRQQKYPGHQGGGMQYGTVNNNNSHQYSGSAGEVGSSVSQQQGQQQGQTPAEGRHLAGEGEGDGEGVPPSYDQAVRGDNKVQT